METIQSLDKKTPKLNLDFKDSKYATGRRKTSIARVFVQEGKGGITINEKDYKSYFSTTPLHYKVEQPQK